MILTILSAQRFLKEVIFLQWTLLNRINFKFLIILDYLTFIFLFTVRLITVRVLIFRKSYITRDKNNKKFFFLLLLFVFRIFLLILSPNNLRILLGWDGLGVSSYLLVIYYNSRKSSTSGMITLLINRGGDALILTALAMQWYQFHWDTSHLGYLENTKTIVFFFTLGLITKSAQIPFSSWLPAAIAAPTPVSSLVHSSTLVTAGVYLIIRINQTYYRNKIHRILFILGTLTTFIASLLALVENDMKKIVALSTLSQLGFMVTMLGLNCWFLAFGHLINHAFFKALLFITTGNMIHSSNDSQDLKITGNKNLNIFNSLMIVVTTSISMAGLTFLSAFYAKEVILENMITQDALLLTSIIFFVGIFLTPIYSIRALNIYYFFMIKSGAKRYSENNDLMVNTRMVLLLVPTLFSGTLIRKNFYYKEESSIPPIAYLTLALVMIGFTLILLTLIEYKNHLFTNCKKLFFSTIWGLTQIYLITIPLISIKTPTFLINVEKNLTMHAFNLIFHEITLTKYPAKIFLSSLLISTRVTLMLIICYYLNNKETKTR